MLQSVSDKNCGRIIEEETVRLSTDTSSVVAWFMSAPAWTSSSSTSVWPSRLATHNGLPPSYIR